jgi:large subunit ribosomal protein L6
MSRVGKKPIPLPKGVKVNIGNELSVEGPKGKLSVPIPQGIRVEKSDAVLEIQRDGDQFAALHGLTRALASNAVTGVSTGFATEMEIVGIGYRCEVKGPIVSFSLGYSHPIEFVLPDGISAKVEKQTALTLMGIDKQLLGQTAANVRALRPPEPYKLKGIRYKGEALRKKVGKTGASAK